MAMSTKPSHEPSIAICCHNYGKVGNIQSGYAVTSNAFGASSKPARQKQAGSGGGTGQKWCTLNCARHDHAQRPRMLLARRESSVDP